MRDQIFIFRGDIPPYCLKNKHVIAACVKYLTLKLHRKNKKILWFLYSSINTKDRLYRHDGGVSLPPPQILNCPIPPLSKVIPRRQVKE